MRKLCTLLLMVLFAVGCTHKSPTPSKPQPTPIVIEDDEPIVVTPEDDQKPIVVDDYSKHKTPRWSAIASVKERTNGWTYLMHESLKAHGKWLLSEANDMSMFCGGPCKASKLDMMTYFMSLMVEHESWFRPHLEYKEDFRAWKGGPIVISRGLFQISYHSSRQSRYNCGFTDPKQMHGVHANMKCSVKILNTLAKENGVVMGGNSTSTYKGGSRYWSVLRPSRSKAYNDIVKKMKAAYTVK